MVKLSVGDVVFVNFPFSNLAQSKLRPAVIIASLMLNVKGNFLRSILN